MQATLLGTGAFAKVDIFNAYFDTPTASQLADYHAVLVYSWDGFSNATLLGDRLADYHDQGGGVVVAWAANMHLQGAYGAADNGYALLDYATGSMIDSSDTLEDVLEPESPLLTGVVSLGASNAFRSSALVISGRGFVVARWGGAQPLVVRGVRGNRTLVELNLFPPFFVSGDGADLMLNVLKYSRCMLCGPGTFSAAGEACLVLGACWEGQCICCIAKELYPSCASVCRGQVPVCRRNYAACFVLLDFSHQHKARHSTSSPPPPPPQPTNQPTNIRNPN